MANEWGIVLTISALIWGGMTLAIIYKVLKWVRNTEWMRNL